MQQINPSNSQQAHSPVQSQHVHAKVGTSVQTNAQQPHVMRKFPSQKSGLNQTLLYLGITVLVVLSGIGTGWVLAGTGGSTNTDGTSQVSEDKTVKQSDTEAGVLDESAFPDTAEGKLSEGGIQGEGTHKLERPGGASQTVYLTSTVIDLESFVGKNVKVWGQSLSGKSAGWLMDVGKIKVVE